MFEALKSGGGLPAVLSPKSPPVPEQRPPTTNGTTNGSTNGTTNGSMNGSTNGSKNAATNGTANGSTNSDGETQNRTVHCLGVPEGSEEHELREHFSACGEVSESEK